MRSAFLLPALLLLSCSRPAEEPRQAKLMDGIEGKIRLPGGARPLDHYARFYAFDARDKVVANYVLPYNEGPHAGDECEELGENGTSRMVKCEPIEDWPKGAKAGQRKWVPSERDLPAMADGGCSQVNVGYDPASGKVRAYCNGDL